MGKFICQMENICFTFKQQHCYSRDPT